MRSSMRAAPRSSEQPTSQPPSAASSGSRQAAPEETQPSKMRPTSSALATYYRVATATEPPSYTWTFGAAGFGGAVGGMASFTGVDNNSPIDDEAGTVTPNGTNHTAPSITTTMAPSTPPGS